MIKALIITTALSLSAGVAYAQTSSPDMQCIALKNKQAITYFAQYDKPNTQHDMARVSIAVLPMVMMNTIDCYPASEQDTMKAAIQKDVEGAIDAFTALLTMPDQPLSADYHLQGVMAAWK